MKIVHIYIWMPIILLGLIDTNNIKLFEQPYSTNNYFVSQDGTGTACSQSVPCNYDTAISLSIAEDNIYFAEGQYTTDDSSEVIYLNKAIHLYGGCCNYNHDVTMERCVKQQGREVS